MWTSCRKECANCRIPDCISDCTNCKNKNKKRCKKRGKCLSPRWVGSAPAPAPAPLPPPPSCTPSSRPPSSSSPGFSGDNASSYSSAVAPKWVGSAPAPLPSPSSGPPSSRPPPSSSPGSSGGVASSFSSAVAHSLRMLQGEGTLETSSPSGPSPMPPPTVPLSATSPPSKKSMSGNTSSRKRRKGSSSSTPDEEPPRQYRKTTLQDEHQRNLRVEKELVELIKDKEGLAGVKYRCRTCGLVKQCRLRCVSHAAICGGRIKKAYRRGNCKNLLPCNICGHQESSREKLLQHRRREHRSLMRRPQCWKCNLSFSSAKSYR